MWHSHTSGQQQSMVRWCQAVFQAQNTSQACKLTKFHSENSRVGGEEGVIRRETLWQPLLLNTRNEQIGDSEYGTPLSFIVGFIDGTAYMYDLFKFPSKTHEITNITFSVQMKSLHLEMWSNDSKETQWEWGKSRVQHQGLNSKQHDSWSL